MSKCKAVLDSEKIIEIRVKTKSKESPHKDASETKDPGDSKQDSVATAQQRK